VTVPPSDATPVDPAGHPTATTADHLLAHGLAAEAGAALLELRERLAAEGVDPAELKAAGDRTSHDLLMAALAEGAPEDAVLSEEGKDSPERLSARRVWIVDPLDGTREFSEPPRSDWAVHVALAIDHEVVAGAVALFSRLDGSALRYNQEDPWSPDVLICRTELAGQVLPLLQDLS